MEAGDNKKALARFKKIIATAPESDLADDANMMSAQIFEKQQLWKDALVSYLAVGSGEIETPYETEALLRAARIHVRFSQFREALELTRTISRSSNATPAQKYDASELRGEVLLSENRVLEALELYV